MKGPCERRPLVGAKGIGGRGGRGTAVQERWRARQRDRGSGCWRLWGKGPEVVFNLIFVVLVRGGCCVVGAFVVGPLSGCHAQGLALRLGLGFISCLRARASSACCRRHPSRLVPPRSPPWAPSSPSPIPRPITSPSGPDWLNLPCPIKYEEIQRENIMSLKPELFEGLRFDFTKPLNQRFSLSHRSGRPTRGALAWLWRSAPGSHSRRCAVRPAMAVAPPPSTVALRHAALRFPPPPGVLFSYGTAGFRTDAALLPSTLFRMGVLAALRALSTHAATGLMVTASHNPAHENGVKLVDPTGGMLAVSWESYSDLLANAPDADHFILVVEDIIRNEKIHDRGRSGEKVFLGRDTRPSGQSLLEAALKGVEAVGGVEAQDMGILTTPQLHWMVRCTNKRVPATESDYFGTLSRAFSTLSDLRPSGLGECTVHEDLIVDAANGVGAGKLLELQKITPSLRVRVRNSGFEGEGLLNDGVGADFVQKEKVPPRGFGSSVDLSKRCASLDGDADRLVYFYVSPMAKNEATSASFQLLDGDKIATLFASYIMDQLQILRGASPLSGAIPSSEIPDFGIVKVAVIQTAYANGASTNYIKQVLGLEVAVTSTGVKHLHKRAEQYDVGIYFEANGHGTVLFSDNFIHWLQDAASREEVGKRNRAAIRLVAVSEMVNQAVGDALSGILMVETVLQYRNWSLQEWNDMYTDLPSRQLKVKVADRSLFQTTDAETKVSFPSNLQAAIDAEVEKHEGGRAFVRPSGTEDVVRIYAEAVTQKSADALAREVAIQVFRIGAGIGEEP